MGIFYFDSRHLNPNVLRNGWRVIVLSVLLLVSSFLHAQERTVTGTIKSDEDGGSLPGVTILVKGTSRGTITDIEGKYSITAASSEVLVVSFVGFKSQEVTVGNQSIVNISLEVDISTLEEVVVIGYGSVSKSDVTTSVASISQKELKNLPVSGIDQAIQGRLAGVTVNANGGQPGGGISVRVRGVTSVNGNEPLYVIDGVPVLAQSNTLQQNFLGGGSGQTAQSVMATLNPADIESIDVLKDASAQAIYGSRAANGVVLITTKRGKAGEGKVTYDSYFGASVVPQKLDVMNLQEYAQYTTEITSEINGVTGGNQQPNAAFLDPSLLGKGTDWQNEIYRTGGVQSHLISFSGGQNKSNYYFSLGSFNQTGILIGTGFKRYSIRGSIDNQIKDWLKVGFSTNMSRSDQQIGLADAFDAVTSVVLFNSPAAPIRDLNGDYVGQIRVGNATVGNPSNPVAMAKLRDVASINTRIYGNLYGEMKLIDGLTLRNELNYDFNLRSDVAFQPYVTNQDLKVDIITPSKLREQRTNSIFYSVKNYFNYNKTFGNHNFFATLGHEVQYSKYDYIQANRNNLTLNLPSLNAGSAENQGIGAGANIWAMESYFTRLNYSFQSKYAASVTLRRDGSSSFGENNRYGYFPAASVSWTVSNESFLKGNQFLNFLKVRGGYGAVGNQQVNANSYTANVNLVTPSPFGNGSRISNIANPDLSWESVVTYNAGVDGTVFRNKLDFTVDVYKKMTTDMLLPTQLGTFSGLGTNFDDIQTPIANNGKMTNTGIDLSLTGYIIKKGDLDFTSTLVFSHYKNKLNYLNTDNASIRGYFDEYGTRTLVSLTQAGYPVGAFYGYKTDGLYTTPEELNSLATGLDVRPDALWLGDVKFKDLDGDGDVDDQDVTIIGNPNPKFTAGWTNSFRYKAFSLTVFLYTSVGADILNYSKRQTLGLSSQYNNQLTDVLDRYTETNPDAKIPRYNQWHNNNQRISDRFIEDGSYFRIQNVQLGYNVPKVVLNKILISSLKVYVSSQNLATFSKYSGYSPEIGTISDNVQNGIIINVDNGRYPVPRTFTVGVNVEF